MKKATRPRGLPYGPSCEDIYHSFPEAIYDAIDGYFERLANEGMEREFNRAHVEQEDKARQVTGLNR